MKVIILAGGFGTRLAEKTDRIPKPMVRIGSHPILWHIMKIYSHHGYSDFLIALGYKGRIIKEYFLKYYELYGDLTVDLSKGSVNVHQGEIEQWKVNLVDTGLHTKTGGRIKRLQNWIGDETFMVTYGDGVANINIKKLVEFHQSHDRLGTITSVRPPSRFGGIVFEENNGEFVKEFTEKPQIGAGWINGGFMVFDPSVFKYLEGDETILERGPLENMAQQGELASYRHHDFWQCMDHLRDVQRLESLWNSDDPPWRIWE